MSKSPVMSITPDMQKAHVKEKVSFMQEDSFIPKLAVMRKTPAMQNQSEEQKSPVVQKQLVIQKLSAIKRIPATPLAIMKTPENQKMSATQKSVKYKPSAMEKQSIGQEQLLIQIPSVVQKPSVMHKPSIIQKQLFPEKPPVIPEQSFLLKLQDPEKRVIVRHPKQCTTQSMVTALNNRGDRSTLSGNMVHTATSLTPGEILKRYMDRLTIYEHHEIFRYTEIYFFGPSANKCHGFIGDPNNCGFDDTQGYYIQVPHDHIAYRYEVLRVLGKGSYGQVLKVYDHKLQQHVALKMVRNKKDCHQQAMDEIRILKHLKKQDKDNNMNVIHMLDYFTFRNHICMTFELLSMDLYKLIKKTKFTGFNLPTVRKFANSILQCLDSLQTNKIIHCDLKPENIMLKEQGKTDIKVVDFGLSGYDHQRSGRYIQTRFYRAPEVILGGNCGMPIDMWSLGCTLAELLTGDPLLPGEDEYDQLACIIELFGMPPKKVLGSSKRYNCFFTSKGHPDYCTVRYRSDGSVVLNGSYSETGTWRGPPGSRNLATALKGCKHPLFINFLMQCFEWDPARRMTPRKALQHPWLQ
ncbi:dual specificity tyrosine-phosphorylation-regulated kinase 2 [Pelobates cultripes]|uniref:dual-specificity kinase n=2 Tax=Pelobates cultripes TaxID=61616 RepID=A0AAD1W225_PELCU|nr:dual specificity tyrosine-phosphorylation-regulated kinase 2 [Pelobates cultripes]